MPDIAVIHRQLVQKYLDNLANAPWSALALRAKGQVEDLLVYGLPIFPLARASKVPIARFAPHGAKSATRDLDTIYRWCKASLFWNWGFALPLTMVVDIDSQEAEEKWARMTTGKELPRTLRVQTRRGQHIYFRLSKHMKMKGKLAPGIDIKTGPGAYVVAPGCRHPDGGYYTWVERGPYDNLIAQAPDWLVAMARSTGVPSGKRQTKASRPATVSGQVADPSKDKMTLRWWASRVAGARRGTRNCTCATAGYHCGRLVGAGRLRFDEVESALRDAADRNGILGEEPRPTLRTLHRAIQMGSRSPRYPRRRYSEAIYDSLVLSAIEDGKDTVAKACKYLQMSTVNVCRSRDRLMAAGRIFILHVPTGSRPGEMWVAFPTITIPTPPSTLAPVLVGASG